jgi:uncharacterized protein (DUF1015 family)
LWKIDDVLEIKWIQNIFEKIDNLYIAAPPFSSQHYCQKKMRIENTAKDYLLSYLISENNVKIEFNRLVKDLNGFEKKFLSKLTKNFIIENLKQQPFQPTENINLECILTMNSIV